MAYDGTLKFDTSMDTSGFQKDANSLGNIVKGLGAFKIIEQGFQAITASIDNAVSRYDTLNRFPKIMEQMGFSADETDTAMRRLSDGVQGLPTALDAIIGSAQRIASMTGDLAGAADVTLALNNAFLASGASSDAAARGMEQYMQIISRGKPEMEDWKTLQETMPYALQKVAESFGFAGTSATRDFYAALQSGEITVEQMNARFVELSTATGGFAETAKTATGGIGTAFTNMKTSITRGVANVVESIDKGLSKTRFKSIENAIKSAGKGIESVLNALAKAFGFMAEHAEAVIPIVVALNAAFLAWKIGKVLSGVVLGLKTAALQMSLYALSAKGAITVDALQTAGLTAKELLIGVLTHKIALATAAQYVWNAAMSANPIGLILAAVIAFTGAVVALAKVLESDAYKEHKANIEEIDKAYNDLNAKTEESSAAYFKAQSALRAQTAAGEELIGTLADMPAALDGSAEGEAGLASTIEKLNAEYEGLNLTVEEYNANPSAALDRAREFMQLADAVAEAALMLERQNQLLQEERAAKDGLAQIAYERQRIAASVQNGNMSLYEAGLLLTKLDRQEKDYNAALEDNATLQAEVAAAVDDAAAKQERALLNRQKALNGAVDAEGRNLTQIALKWGLTTDEVLAQMDALDMGLTEFSQHMTDTHTKEGLSLDDLAAKWGTTAQAIQTEMDNMGISMQEWSDQQDQAWADYEEAVREHTAGVVNGFKEIPGEFEQSAQEMLDILIANKERYAEWESTMEEITRQLGPTAAEEFRQLGPEATSAMQEILDSAELLDQYREVFGVKVDEVTGMAVEDWNDPNFIGAPSAALDTSAQQVTNNTTLATAMAGTAENAVAAVDAVDFSQVGQNIASDIVNGLNGADVSGIMDGIAAAVQSGADQAQGIAAQMMTQINLAIVSRSATVKASAASCVNGVIAVLTELKTKGSNLAAQMMAQINSAIIARTAAAKVSAASLARGVVSSLEPMVSGGANAAERMMDGMVEALNNKAGTLYAKAKEIANKVSSTLRAAWDEHSPSRVSYRIMEFFMRAMYNAMGDMSGLLYTKADSVADGLTDRLTLEPGMFTSIVDKLRSVTEANPLGGAALVPQAAYAGGGGGTSYVTSLTQNITTPKPLSASEMTREGQDLLRRSRWQLP